MVRGKAGEPGFEPDPRGPKPLVLPVTPLPSKSGSASGSRYPIAHGAAAATNAAAAAAVPVHLPLCTGGTGAAVAVDVHGRGGGVRGRAVRRPDRLPADRSLSASAVGAGGGGRVRRGWGSRPLQLRALLPDRQRRP